MKQPSGVKTKQPPRGLFNAALTAVSVMRHARPWDASRSPRPTTDRLPTRTSSMLTTPRLTGSLGSLETALTAGDRDGSTKRSLPLRATRTTPAAAPGASSSCVIGGDRLSTPRLPTSKTRGTPRPGSAAVHSSPLMGRERTPREGPMTPSLYQPQGSKRSVFRETDSGSRFQQRPVKPVGVRGTSTDKGSSSTSPRVLSGPPSGPTRSPVRRVVVKRKTETPEQPPAPQASREVSTSCNRPKGTPMTTCLERTHKQFPGAVIEVTRSDGGGKERPKETHTAMPGDAGTALKKSSSKGGATKPKSKTKTTRKVKADKNMTARAPPRPGNAASFVVQGDEDMRTPERTRGTAGSTMSPSTPLLGSPKYKTVVVPLLSENDLRTKHEEIVAKIPITRQHTSTPSSLAPRAVPEAASVAIPPPAAVPSPGMASEASVNTEVRYMRRFRFPLDRSPSPPAASRSATDEIHDCKTYEPANFLSSCSSGSRFSQASPGQRNPGSLSPTLPVYSTAKRGPSGSQPRPNAAATADSPDNFTADAVPPQHQQDPPPRPYVADAARLPIVRKLEDCYGY